MNRPRRDVAPPTIDGVEPGTRVEVRSRFDSHWARGFEVAEEVPDNGSVQYRVRRRSDGAILPVLFADDDLREDLHRKDMWWM